VDDLLTITPGLEIGLDRRRAPWGASLMAAPAGWAWG